MRWPGRGWGADAGGGGIAAEAADEDGLAGGGQWAVAADADAALMDEVEGEVDIL